MMKKFSKMLPAIAVISVLLVAGCSAPSEDIISDNASSNDQVCAQVLTAACNPSTGEIVEFPTACIDSGFTTDLTQCSSFAEQVAEAESVDTISSDLDDVDVDSILDGL